MENRSPGHPTLRPKGCDTRPNGVYSMRLLNKRPCSDFGDMHVFIACAPSHVRGDINENSRTIGCLPVSDFRTHVLEEVRVTRREQYKGVRAWTETPASTAVDQ